MDGLVVKMVETAAEREAAFALRVRVFVHEQGVPTAEELDEHDRHVTHSIALLNGEAIGTGWVVYEASQANTARPAVNLPWAGRVKPGSGAWP